MENKKKKNTKQKSFFFKDYNESEIIVNKENINLAKVSLNRIAFLFFIFFSLILIFSIKIIYISLSQDKKFFSKDINQNLILIKERRDIVDRNGIILARNIDIYDASVIPKLVKDKKKTINKFKTYFSRARHQKN